MWEFLPLFSPFQPKALVTVTDYRDARFLNSQIEKSFCIRCGPLDYTSLLFLSETGSPFVAQAGLVLNMIPKQEIRRDLRH